MADRTFHKRFTISAKVGIGVFTALAAYFFWTKTAIIGILLAIVVVGMIERILHTTYTFRRVKPIDRDEEMEFIVVSEGRFSARRTVPLCDLVRTERIHTFFGLDRCLLIEYGAGHMVSLQPDNMEAFEQEIKRRLGKNE